MPFCLGPVDPPLEVRGLDLVALDFLSTGLGIAGVEVEPVRAGDQRQRLVQVGAQLIGRARLARIIARHRQSAADRFAGVLETADIVALPAVQRDRNLGEPLKRPVDIDPQRRVSLSSPARTTVPRS